MFKTLMGKSGEQKAAKYLQKKGYNIVEKNYSAFCGEIDIIAEKDEVIVFVEVKKRSSAKYGTGADAVDGRKQKKIIQTARHYIASKSINKLCRFDVISIDNKELTHIENAFIA